MRLDLLRVIAPPWLNYRILQPRKNRKTIPLAVRRESACSRGAIVLSRLIIPWIGTLVTIVRLLRTGEGPSKTKGKGVGPVASVIYHPLPLCFVRTA